MAAVNRIGSCWLFHTQSLGFKFDPFCRLKEENQRLHAAQLPRQLRTGCNYSGRTCNRAKLSYLCCSYLHGLAFLPSIRPHARIRLHPCLEICKIEKSRCALPPVCSPVNADVSSRSSTPSRSSGRRSPAAPWSCRGTGGARPPRPRPLRPPPRRVSADVRLRARARVRMCAIACACACACVGMDADAAGSKPEG